MGRLAEKCRALGLSKMKELTNLLNAQLVDASSSFRFSPYQWRDFWKEIPEDSKPEWSVTPTVPDVLIESLKPGSHDPNDAGGLIMKESMLYWSMTKGVYMFNQGLVEQLDSPIRNMPFEVFEYMPEPIVAMGFQDTLDGLVDLAMVRIPQEMQAETIAPYLKTEDDVRPLFIHVFKLDPKEWFTWRTLPTYCVNGCLDDGRAFWELTKEVLEESEFYKLNQAFGDRSVAGAKYDGTVRKILNCALYLCSVNKDLVFNSSGNEVPQGFAKGLLAESNPRVKVIKYDVGARVGPKLALSKESCSGARNLTKGIRPHVRRAHWHHYWVGPKSDQKLVLKWIAPVVCGSKSSKAVAPSLRKVLTP